MYEGKKGYDLNKRRSTISYLQNDYKIVSKIGFFTHVIAGLVTRLKLQRESIAHYEDKGTCLKTPNSLVRGDAKSDSREIV